MKRIIVALSALAAFQAVCLLVRPATNAGGKLETRAVYFNKDVAPIFNRSCVKCHRPGEASPMSLLTYQMARPWAKSIREKVLTRQMPPWHADPRYGEFANDCRLTQSEINTIVAWADGGAKEGDPKDLPSAPEFVEGWNIGRPDLVLTMPQEYSLDATGPDEYQNFEIPTGFTEDRYVQAAEARPGNRKIVHHIVAFIQPPPQPGQIQLGPAALAKLLPLAGKEMIYYRDGFLMRVKADAPVYNDGCALPNGGGGAWRDTSRCDPFPMMLSSFAPGKCSDVWPPGMAKKIPAGSKLVLQIHYSKVAGTVERDRSSLGLIFAKEPPDKLITTQAIYNSYLRIPPGAEHHRVTACWTAQDDIHIYSLMPHMHFRGKAMEIMADYPEGRSEVLLNVPSYSFSWQTNYILKRPLAAPKGAVFVVTGEFDNSAKNKYNPDSEQAVRWGEPTYDEMLVGFIGYTVDRQHLRAQP